MKAKWVGTTFFLGGLVLALGGYYYWNSPEREIRMLLSDGASGFESEDLNRFMSHISLKYRDQQGLAYLNLKNLIHLAFERFDGYDIKLSEPRIGIDENRATVQVNLKILAIVQGEKTYILGDANEVLPIQIMLIRETLRWKVLAINGFDTPAVDFI